MKFAPLIAALAFALPAGAAAQVSPSMPVLAWHPNGKTPAAIPQPRDKRSCVETANHHRGSKGPITVVVRCTDTAENTPNAPQPIERGE